jgi:hypothetical protein
MTPNGTTDVLVYLKELVLKMMGADAKRTRPHNDDASLMSGLLRTVPTLSHESTNPLAVAAKQVLDNTMSAAARQRDDPWLLFLEDVVLGPSGTLNPFTFHTLTLTITLTQTLPLYHN